MTAKGISRAEVLRKLIDDSEGRGVHLTAPTRNRMAGQLNAVNLQAKLIRMASASPQIEEAARVLETTVKEISQLLQGDL